MKPPRPVTAALAAVLMLVGGIFVLSCRLPAELMAEPDIQAGPSIATAIAGSARVALGSYFYRQADLYFHRGVAHKKKQAFEGSIFQRLSSAITPEEHQHLSGLSVREMMPWLELALRCNPTEVEYPLVAAYWLSADAGRPDLAHRVLREARIENPANCRLPAEEARILIRQGRLDDAQRLLDLALMLWPGGASPDNEDSLLLKRDILLHRAILAESAGEKDLAIRDLTEIARLFPGMTSIGKRIENLRNGTEPEYSARAVLSNLIAAHDSLREQCDREDGKHEHAGEEH